MNSHQTTVRAAPIFVTGGTGYIGRAVVESLHKRGHTVHALVRAESRTKLPGPAIAVVGDALDAATYARKIPRGATLVHLIGTPHPNPSKAAEFERVDLGSIRAATRAAHEAGVSHLVYVSVAQPAPVMRAYINARIQGEASVRETGMPATILRPWYVIGPGHRWPLFLLPLYALLERLPSTRDGARRLGLVTLAQMVAAIVHAVEHPPGSGVRIIEVSEIRTAGRASRP